MAHRGCSAVCFFFAVLPLRFALSVNPWGLNYVLADFRLRKLTGVQKWHQCKLSSERWQPRFWRWGGCKLEFVEKGTRKVPWINTALPLWDLRLLVWLSWVASGSRILRASTTSWEYSFRTYKPGCHARLNPSANCHPRPHFEGGYYHKP